MHKIPYISIYVLINAKVIILSYAIIHTIYGSIPFIVYCLVNTLVYLLWHIQPYAYDCFTMVTAVLEYVESAYAGHYSQ